MRKLLLLLLVLSMPHWVAAPTRAEGIDGVGIFEPRSLSFQAFVDLGAPLRSTLAFDAGRERNALEPLSGDWDGDGDDELALFAPRSRRLARFASFEDAAPTTLLTLEIADPRARLLPVAGDWDGDDDDELALFDPAALRLYVFADLADGVPDATVDVVSAGRPAKLRPLAGDWDGDGDDEPGFYNPAARVFVLLADLADGIPDVQIVLDARSRKLVPLAGDWDGDGVDDLGVFDSSGRRFQFLADREDGVPDLATQLDLGRRGKPLAGHWVMTATAGGGDPLPEGAFCDPVAVWDPALSALEVQVLALVNQRRAQARSCGGFGQFAAAAPLESHAMLRCAARSHSLDMAQRGYFSHTSPEGDAPWDRASDAGYAWSTIGENIALGYPTPSSVVDAWLASDGHCANLMSADYGELGVGVALRAASGQLVWTQLFGAPR